jgi:hypothetical protein
MAAAGAATSQCVRNRFTAELLVSARRMVAVGAATSQVALNWAEIQAASALPTEAAGAAMNLVAVS